MARSPIAADPFNREIGNRVRLARVNRGWSQERLAAALGLTFQQVQKYEKGTNRVSAATLIRIAGLLDVATTSLLPDEAAIATGELPSIDRTDVALLAALGRMPPRVATAFRAAAASLAAACGHD